MATNEVLRICGCCQHLNPVPIDGMGPRLSCGKCGEDITMHNEVAKQQRRELAQQGRRKSAYGDLMDPPTEELKAKYWPLLKRRRI